MLRRKIGALGLEMYCLTCEYTVELQNQINMVLKNEIREIGHKRKFIHVETEGQEHKLEIK